MITLEEIKRQLRIHPDFTEDDDYLLSLLEVAKEMAANYIEDELTKDGVTPATIKQAVLIKICDLYDVERGSYISGTFKENTAFYNLLNFHKKIVMY